MQCPSEDPLKFVVRNHFLVRVVLERVDEANQLRLAVARPNVVGNELGLQIKQVLFQLVGALIVEIIKEVVQGDPNLEI